MTVSKNYRSRRTSRGSRSYGGKKSHRKSSRKTRRRSSSRRRHRGGDCGCGKKLPSFFTTNGGCGGEGSCPMPKIMGGGCGEGMCSGAAAMPKMMGGGCGDGMCSAGKVMGGSANLDLIPKDSFYKYNSNIGGDPANPSAVVGARFAGDYSRTSGGKRRRRQKKMRGGSNFLSGIYSQIQNAGSGMGPFTSFGTVNGTAGQTAVASGVGGVVNSSVTSQPVVTDKYGFTNPPLA